MSVWSWFEDPENFEDVNQELDTWVAEGQRIQSYFQLWSLKKDDIATISGYLEAQWYYTVILCSVPFDVNVNILQFVE